MVAASSSIKHKMSLTGEIMKLAKNICAVVAVIATAVTTNAYAQQSSARKPLSTQPDLSVYNKAPNSSQVRRKNSEVRLLPGSYKNGEWLAGVEIYLAPGWKTYWRVPGDAGVPAEFVWKNSNNLASAKVLWPAPKRYQDISGKSIGYKKHVVFPVRIKAKTGNQPVDVDLQLYYAVCSDICVPARARLALTLLPKPGADKSAQLIARYVKKVPVKNATGVSLASASAKIVRGKPVLEVKLKGAANNKTDILIEGYEDAYFDAPKLVDQGNDTRTFQLPIDGLQDVKKLKGQKLTITVLSGEIRLVGDVTVN